MNENVMPVNNAPRANDGLNNWKTKNDRINIETGLDIVMPLEKDLVEAKAIGLNDSRDGMVEADARKIAVKTKQNENGGMENNNGAQNTEKNNIILVKSEISGVPAFGKDHISQVADIEHVENLEQMAKIQRIANMEREAVERLAEMERMVEAERQIKIRRREELDRIARLQRILALVRNDAPEPESVAELNNEKTEERAEMKRAEDVSILELLGVETVTNTVTKKIRPEEVSDVTEIKPLTDMEQSANKKHEPESFEGMTKLERMSKVDRLKEIDRLANRELLVDEKRKVEIKPEVETERLAELERVENIKRLTLELEAELQLAAEKERAAEMERFAAKEREAKVKRREELDRVAKLQRILAMVRASELEHVAQKKQAAEIERITEMKREEELKLLKELGIHSKDQVTAEQTAESGNSAKLDIVDDMNTDKKRNTVSEEKPLTEIIPVEPAKLELPAETNNKETLKTVLEMEREMKIKRAEELENRAKEKHKEKIKRKEESERIARLQRILVEVRNANFDRVAEMKQAQLKQASEKKQEEDMKLLKELGILSREENQKENEITTNPVEKKASIIAKENPMINRNSVDGQNLQSHMKGDVHKLENINDGAEIEQVQKDGVDLEDTTQKIEPEAEVKLNTFVDDHPNIPNELVEENVDTDVIDWKQRVLELRVEQMKRIAELGKEMKLVTNEDTKLQLTEQATTETGSVAKTETKLLQQLAERREKRVEVETAMNVDRLKRFMELKHVSLERLERECEWDGQMRYVTRT